LKTSEIRGLVVVALAVVTVTVLLAVVPKGGPYGGVASGGSTVAVATTLPTGSTTTPGSTNTTTVPTTTTFPVEGRPVLKLGSTGTDVFTLQQRLTALGYNAGDVNGTFSPATQIAVMNFQKAKNLGADGVVGPATWAALAAG
jgi:peptidoglycan hydrolase-like protein with peptidoglycan-binding domain